MLRRLVLVLMLLAGLAAAPLARDWTAEIWNPPD